MSPAFRNDICVTLLASVRPVVAYVADELGESYGVARYVPVACAVFVCEPETAEAGPTTHVTMWLLFAATATGSVIVANVALHEETSTMLSVMLIGGPSGTSPVFSTV